MIKTMCLVVFRLAQSGCVYALREKRMIPLSENVHDTGHSLLALSWMLGSKDLGFYVFRTLICIVGKP